MEVSSAVPAAGGIDQAIASATSAPEADRRDTDDANSLHEVVHSGADLSQESVNEISAPARRLTMPRNLEEMMRGVPRKGLKHIPLASAGKCATAWAECLEGSMAGSAVWGQIAEFRTRLLFCGYSPDCDKPVELKTRLKLWEKGKFNELAARASSSALLCAEKSNHTHDGNDDLKRGDIARSKACDDALRKAIQGFVNGVVTPTPEQRTAWAELFLPQGELDQMANSAELEEAQTETWGKGDVKAAKREVLQWCKDQRGEKHVPWASFPSCVQPGPSGDTYEHLMDCLACNEHGPRKRLRRALDNLTYRWMAGNLPDSARWLLDTELFWVSKEKQGVELDDDTAWLVEADNCDKFSEVNQEIIQGAGDKDDAMSTDTLDDGGTELERPKVRPIQMGEMLRKFVCK